MFNKGSSGYTKIILMKDGIVTNTETTSLLDNEALEDDNDPKGIKEMGFFKSFGVVINCIVGTGFFAVPYTYYHTGLPLSLGLTVVSSIFSILGALWTLECVARARGIDFARRRCIPHSSAYNVFPFRQIEYSESAKIFSGWPGMIFCQIIFLFYSVGSLWAYASMFSSTCANLVMKYIVKDTQDCIIETDPSNSCQFAYIVSCIAFATFVLILEVFDMSNLAIVQTFFTIYRFLAFFLILLSCIITLSYNGCAWLHRSESALLDSSNNPPWYSIEMSGFPGLFSSISFAFTCSYNLPNILSPMKKGKKDANKVVVSSVIISTIIYLVLAVLLPLVLGEDILQYVILNWSRYGEHGFVTTTSSDISYNSDGEIVVETNWFSNIIKLLVMLFPMMNMISTFPMVAGSIGFAFYSSIPKHVSLRLGKVGPLLFRFLVTIPPFLLALFIPSLGFIVKFCGLSAVFLVIFIPAFFHWYSKRLCRDEWKTPHSGWWSHTIFVVFAMLYGAFALVYGLIRFFMDEF